MTPARASSLVLTLSLAAACSSRPPPRPVTALRPPDPISLTLAEVRVSHAAWAPPTPPPIMAPTSRRTPRRSGMTIDMALPVLVSTNEPVRACYKAFLAFSPQAGGTIITLITVGGGGSVSDVETIGTPDPSLAIMSQCVLTALRTRRFPAVGAPTLLSFPFSFRSGEINGQTLPAPVLPAPRPNEMQVPNSENISVRPWRPALIPASVSAPVMTRELVDAVVPDVQSLADTCYAATLVMNPAATGDFTLRLAVEPSGNVNRLDITPPEFPSPMRDCVVTLGRQLHFHPSLTGAVVTIPVSLHRLDPEANAPAEPASAAGGGLMPVAH
jgi:hypothetical protein